MNQMKLWGAAAAAAYGAAAAKYVAHRVPDKKWDRLFVKVHYIAGVLLPVGAAVHTVQAHRAGKLTVAAAASGAAANAGVLGLLVSHFFSTPLGKYAMPMHRAATAATGASLVWHLLSVHKK